MSVRTKSRILPERRVPAFKYDHDRDWRKATIKGESHVIAYATGYHWRDGRLVWKECEHIVDRPQSEPIGELVHRARNGKDQIYTCRGPEVSPSAVVPAYNPDLLHEAVQGLCDDLDLNCRDSVLCYSGLLQAIPLVGTALKLSSILNSAGRNLGRSLRRKPFNTVIRSMISLDFIDRFVVRPMISDTVAFVQASNYVVSTYLKAREMSYEPAVALKRHAKETLSSSIVDFRGGAYGASAGDLGFIGHDRTEVTRRVGVFARAKVDYNLAAFDPIKLWMARTGITRPLESLWDLVPFSFVVDYITRAGDFVTGLSNFLVDQDALKGRIGSIYDCWMTRKEDVSVFRKVTGAYLNLAGSIKSFTPDAGWAGKTRFLRYPVYIGDLLNTLLATDRGFIHCDLTTTKKRTLAELLIQAKLRR